MFAWYRHANFMTIGMHGVEPGVVRSFTLATRARPGFDAHTYGSLRRVVATIAAKLVRQEKTVNCTGP